MSTSEGDYEANPNPANDSSKLGSKYIKYGYLKGDFSFEISYEYKIIAVEYQIASGLAFVGDLYKVIVEAFGEDSADIMNFISTNFSQIASLCFHWCEGVRRRDADCLNEEDCFCCDYICSIVELSTSEDCEPKYYMGYCINCCDVESQYGSYHLSKIIDAYLTGKKYVPDNFADSG